MAAMMKGNQGIPPIGGAWDNGGSNSWINAAFLGLMSPQQLEEFPWFNECSRHHPKLQCFPYQGLFHESYFMTGCNDSNHVMKRFSIHLVSGTRCVIFGAFYCNLTPCVSYGLSLRALSAEDIQCDVDMAKRMNPGYCSKSWDTYGVIFSQFLNALVISAWTSSESFSIRESVAHALLAYYWIMLQTMCTMSKYGSDWTNFWLPHQTVRAFDFSNCSSFVMTCDVFGRFLFNERCSETSSYFILEWFGDNLR